MPAIDIRSLHGRLLAATAFTISALLASGAQAAAPGVTAIGGASSSLFNLNAEAAYISQPDGASLYSWGYGCTGAATFVPQGITGSCRTMQVPGPTMIVTAGDVVTVTLTNNLPPAAGNTSILFPGFKVCAGTLNPTTEACSGALTGVPGVLAREALHGQTVTYSFVTKTAGTHSYYSGTRGTLQVEMGLYGALIVLPKLSGGVPTNYVPVGAGVKKPDTCRAVSTTGRQTASGTEVDFRHAAAAYDNPGACYDREYLFQFAEIDPAIHRQAEEQAQADLKKAPADQCASRAGCLVIATEPYHPAYFIINGRSMPDDMDPNYASQYPHQPYNGNPHMHPGELTLIRVIGQGRMQHPLHEHANHVRLLARDGNLIQTATGKLAGPLLFTTTTTPGQTLDGIFQWTGKGLNWDVYAHGISPQGTPVTADDCVADDNGYYTRDSAGNSVQTAANYYEWCPDHNRPLEAKPFGSVGAGGPVTLPDPNILANGAWYSGSPYLGPDANLRSMGATPIPPFGTIANDPGSEAGFAYMWHSHNEREITTNNIFPGGMMMMMLVDPWVFGINEAN